MDVIDVQETCAPIRTVCAWCASKGIETVIVDGPLDSEGRSSHGVCKPHADEMRGAIKVKAISRGPAVVLGAQVEKAKLRGGLAVLESKHGTVVLLDADAARMACVALGVELKR